ncbi:hypothetical protein [Pseudomonas sputi]|uniref:hypothetical protein n=1 Tax=Pseudomonas sputi TaxID=2892325 RepID=UPI001F15C87C|nr:hypothetical protein [Pseudomonas sputi]
MGLEYRDIDARSREHMVQEIEADIRTDRLFTSKRLTEEGVQAWPELLKVAAANHSDDWLADQIRARRLMKSQEQRAKPKGGFTLAQVPHNAPETLAEGEFNRYFVRGLCLKAIEEQIPELVAYRAKHSSAPRPESEAVIGRRFAPEQLLEDIRNSPGVEPALGVPPGPNSGISVKIP